MKFDRLYPVELIFRGKVGSKDEGDNAKAREKKLLEWFARDKPDIIVTGIKEENGIPTTEESDFIYKITGYSTNPNVR